MNADGSNQTRLTHNGADDFGAVWSPDSMRIAFVSDRDGDRDIYVMAADGSGQTSLTHDSVFETWPSWSPDGSRIAFVKGVRQPAIWIAEEDGSVQTRVSGNVDPQEGGPVWSPNGRWIAFTGRVTHIHVVNADGSGETKLPGPGGYNHA